MISAIKRIQEIGWDHVILHWSEISEQNKWQSSSVKTNLLKLKMELSLPIPVFSIYYINNIYYVFIYIIFLLLCHDIFRSKLEFVLQTLQVYTNLLFQNYLKSIHFKYIQIFREEYLWMSSNRPAKLRKCLCNCHRCKPQWHFSGYMFQSPHQKIEPTEVFVNCITPGSFWVFFLEEKFISTSSNSKGNNLSQR